MKQTFRRWVSIADPGESYDHRDHVHVTSGGARLKIARDRSGRGVWYWAVIDADGDEVAAGTGADQPDAFAKGWKVLHELDVAA